MVSIAETMLSKPPLGAALAAGVQALSQNQEIAFSLYRRYVFPLDGMNYWVRVPSSATLVSGPGIQPSPGLATAIVTGGETVQVSPGGLGAARIVGGMIVNPLTDQGITTAESLFVDFTGPAYPHVTATTAELPPGESIAIPSQCTNGAWVNGATDGHKFTVVLEVAVTSVDLPTDVVVQGSFHYDSTIEQREDAITDSNTVIFSALQEVQPFNQIGPDFLYIAHYHDITFAFSSRGRLYEQADLYHYLGKAVYSVNTTQIVDDAANFNPSLVISNSLPIWLNMPNYVPPYPGFVCPIPLYPSYLVDGNLPPPFGSVHIEDSTALGMSPTFGPRLQSGHLCRDRVRVTLYGCDNLTAANFLAFVEQYSYDWMLIGMANSPAIQDEKHTQPELKIIAQRKKIDFEVNYLQSAVRDVARQFIEHVKVQFSTHWLTDPTKETQNAAGNRQAALLA
jgi:hypothetical protein